MKKFLLALLTAVTAAALFCGAAAPVATYSASYDAPAGINAIVVQDNSAAVILQAADIDHIRADYTYTSSYAFESSKLYDFTVAGSTLTVTKTREPNASLIIQSEDTRSCTLTLQVPRQTLANITVSTTNDSITLAGVSAQTASLTTDNGRIEVSNFNGSTLSGTTRNGKITMSGVTSQNVAATIQNSGTLKLENISANVCNAKVQNGSITGSVIGSGSSYGFELAAGGGKIRVSDASDKNFLFFGKDTLQQNADAPNKLNLATPRTATLRSSSSVKRTLKMPVQHLPHRHFFLSGYGQLSQLTPMTTTPRMTRMMPVARLRVLASALLAKTAAMRAHSRVKPTQSTQTCQSGAPPMAKWLTAPVRAVKVMMNTLVPTAVFSS